MEGTLVTLQIWAHPMATTGPHTADDPPIPPSLCEGERREGGGGRVGDRGGGGRYGPTLPPPNPWTDRIFGTMFFMVPCFAPFFTPPPPVSNPYFSGGGVHFSVTQMGVGHRGGGVILLPRHQPVQLPPKGGFDVPKVNIFSTGAVGGTFQYFLNPTANHITWLRYGPGYSVGNLGCVTG